VLDIALADEAMFFFTFGVIPFTVLLHDDTVFSSSSKVVGLIFVPVEKWPCLSFTAAPLPNSVPVLCFRTPAVLIVETDPVGSFIVFLGFDNTLVVVGLDVNERTVHS